MGDVVNLGKSELCKAQIPHKNPPPVSPGCPFLPKIQAPVRKKRRGGGGYFPMGKAVGMGQRKG